MSVRPNPASTDASLAAAARAGQTAAWSELYRRYAPAVLAVGRRLTGSSADAEDVLHDVFLGLPEALRRYEERGSFATWIRRVAAHAAVGRLRTSARRREVDLDAEPAGGAAPLAAHGGRSAWDDDPLLRAALERAIAALPDGLRAAYVLRAVEGYSHAEAAELLGISVGASEVRFHRAVRALRSALGSLQ